VVFTADLGLPEFRPHDPFWIRFQRAGKLSRYIGTVRFWIEVGVGYPNGGGDATLILQMTIQAQAPTALTRGTVRTASERRLVLGVDDTNYELHLDCQAELVAGQRVEGKVIVGARKVWTVSAGGSFISPLAGTPRVIQGRVKAVDGKRLIVQAGATVCVDLPDDRSSLDLMNGEVTPGVMVNVTTLAGARFELAGG
jgi:hypothetical protein